MDSSALKAAPVKTLSELLQEKQDPFILDDYLSERCVKKSLSSNGRNCCCQVNSAKNLKRSRSCDLNRRRKGIPYGSRILRSVLSKLVSTNEGCKLPNCNGSSHEDGGEHATETVRKTQIIAEINQFSSANSVTQSDYWYERNVEENSPFAKQNHGSPSSACTFRELKLHNLRELEAATDEKHQWGCVEDSKQLSPVSVLEELPSNEVQHFLRTRQEENPSTSSFILPKKATDDSIFSASLWELLIKSAIEKQSHIGVAELQHTTGSGSSQYLKTKRVLQQTKQLLFDCVKEAIENNGRTGRRQMYVQEFLGPEELGKIICEQIYSLGKQSIDVTNITQLINSEFYTPIEKWSDFQLLTREIGIEIADAILGIDKMMMATETIFHGTESESYKLTSLMKRRLKEELISQQLDHVSTSLRKDSGPQKQFSIAKISIGARKRT